MSEVSNRSGRPIIPEHVEQFLKDLQELFPVGKDSPKWNEEHDTRDYGRQVFTLNPKQTKQVFMLLRDRHTYRPSVAEVKKAVDDLADMQNREGIPNHAAQSYRSVNEIRAEAEKHRRGSNGEKLIPDAKTTSGESAGRARFRETVRNLPGFKDSGNRAHTEQFNQHIKTAVDPFVED